MKGSHRLPDFSVVVWIKKNGHFPALRSEVLAADALETNDSAVRVLGDEILRTIARELVAAVRKNVTIDWTLRENVRAQLRVLVTQGATQRQLQAWPVHR